MNLSKSILNRIVLTTLIRRGNKALRKLDENCRDAVNINNELLLRIIKDNADTEYGKKYNFSEIHTVDDFKKNVPFTEYDHYAPYIERMIDNNEKNLITVYPIVHYAMSSGSVGVPKLIPVSEETLEIYNSNAIARVFATCNNYHRKHFNKNMPMGLGLNTIEVSVSKTANGITKGSISGAAADKVSKYYPYMFAAPKEVFFPKEPMDMKYLKIRYALEERDLAFMTSAFMTGLVDLMNYMIANWELLTDDIEKGIINKDINIPDDFRAQLEKDLTPNPKRAEELRAEFKKGFDKPIIPRIWKNMGWISAIGTAGFASYTDKMRAFAGPDIPIDVMVYAASESLMAVARAAEKMEYVLLPNAVFYEFLPADDDDDDVDESVTYTIDQLEVGKKYEIIITNVSGFYRYRIKDVIRVTGFHGKSPKIQFVYRKNQLLNIAGEKTNGECMQWAVKMTGKETGTEFLDYCVYPDVDSKPGHYTVLLEPSVPVDIKDLKHLRDVLDEKIGEGNPSYGTKVNNGTLGKLELHLSEMETHALYRELLIAKGIQSNQIKPVRVLDTPMKEKFFFKLIEEE